MFMTDYVGIAGIDVGSAVATCAQSADGAVAAAGKSAGISQYDRP